MSFEDDFNMNELEMERNKNLQKVKHQDALKRNHVALHPQNTKRHEKRKWEECWKLRQQGKHFVTEARFKDRDLRADIYVLDDDRLIEIETTSYELEERKEEYPEDTEFILLGEEEQ